MLKKSIPHIIALLVILVVTSLYFWPHFQNKVVPMHDTIQVRAMQNEAIEHYKETGEVTSWTNSMFGGMPTYQIYHPYKTNLLTYVSKVMSLGTNYPIGAYLMGMISFYILMLLLGVNHWLALIGALFFGLSTNNLILFDAGHMTKVKTIMISPLIISGMLLVFRKKWLLGMTVFAVGMGLNVHFKHPQMTYYLGLVMSILVLIYGFHAIKHKTIPDFAKSLCVILVGLVLAFGSSMTNVWSTYEYGAQTMRGAPVLAKVAGASSSSSEVDGLAWDYAMVWSNGYEDLLSSFIPRVVGGGSGETISKNSAFGKKVRSNKDLQAPLYFGSLPSTSGPIYFGALVFFLFLFGAISYDSPIKWWLVFGVILTMLFSLGKNLEWFNKFFFDYVPLFNKFRTPNSVLSIAVILIPILGILGLHNMITSQDKTKFWKPALWSGAILGSICLIIALIGPSMFDLSSPGDARYSPTQYPGLIDALLEDRASEMRSSALRSLLFILIGMGAIWAFTKDKISVLILSVILGVFGLFDLIQVDRNYVNHDSFVSKRAYKNNFTKRAVDEKILSDSDPYFRVHDVTTDPFNSASASYYHRTVGGYHAAKLQRYEDVKVKYISQNNMTVLNMLNTKYFIVPGQGEGAQPTYQINPAALGNAWFVSGINIVNSANAEFDAIEGLDPAVTAIIHEEFKSSISATTFDKNGRISLTSYAPDRLEYKSNATSNQFAVFSEMWYGPDLGWEATIDGKPVELIRANYFLRSLNVPAGDHTIVMEFKPASIATGNTINLISSLIILLLIVFIIFNAVKKGKLTE